MLIETSELQAFGCFQGRISLIQDEISAVGSDLEALKVVGYTRLTAFCFLLHSHSN